MKLQKWNFDEDSLHYLLLVPFSLVTVFFKQYKSICALHKSIFFSQSNSIVDSVVNLNLQITKQKICRVLYLLSFDRPTHETF